MDFPLTLSDVQTRYPEGVYDSEYGCFYFLDYDGDLGYYPQLADGNFEDDVKYVDLDTMSEEERTKCEFIAATIAS